MGPLLLLLLATECDGSAYVHPFVDQKTNWNEDFAGDYGDLPSVQEREKAKARGLVKSLEVKSASISLEGELLPSYGCRTPKLPYQSCNPPSIPIKWEHAPNQTKSFVVIVDQDIWGTELEKGASTNPFLLHNGEQLPNSYRNPSFSGFATLENMNFRIVVMAMGVKRFDLKDFFLENPTALGNEIQHHIIKSGKVLDAAYVKFQYPGSIMGGGEVRVIHAGADAV